MDTKAKSQFRLLFPCYFSFFVNGAMVLLVGAILPYIIEEAGINYSVAGGFLSAFAIGNLLASFVNPPMASRIGRKATIVVFSAFIPVMLLVITFLPPVPVIYAAFILIGIGRGSVSIINNAVVNDNSNGSPAALNLTYDICGRCIYCSIHYFALHKLWSGLESSCIYNNYRLNIISYIICVDENRL